MVWRWHCVAVARQTAGVPLPVALGSRYHGLKASPRAAFLPGPQGWGSSLTAAKEPLPRGRAPGLPGWRTPGSAPADVRDLSEQSCGVRTRRTRQKRIPKGRREVNGNL